MIIKTAFIDSIWIPIEGECLEGIPYIIHWNLSGTQFYWPNLDAFFRTPVNKGSLILYDYIVSERSDFHCFLRRTYE